MLVLIAFACFGVGAVAGWVFRPPLTRVGLNTDMARESLAGSFDNTPVVAVIGDYVLTRKEFEIRWNEILPETQRAIHFSRGGPIDYLAKIIEEKLLAQESAADVQEPPPFELIGRVRLPDEPPLYLPPLEQELAIHGGSYLNESIDAIRERHAVHAGAYIARGPLLEAEARG